MGIYSYSNETSFKIKYWGSRLEEKSLQKQRPFLLLQRSKASSKSTIGKAEFWFQLWDNCFAMYWFKPILIMIALLGAAT